jgi:cystathionine beta-lyase
MYNFSHTTCQDEKKSIKYSMKEELFGTKDVIPLWVADMDIETPSFVLEAICKRVLHPFFGYEAIQKSAYLAQIEWMKRHHGMEFIQEDIFYSPSVVSSIHIAIEAFTKKGDEVIVQTPVYPPFFQTVTKLGRKLVKNPLVLGEDGSYSFDFQTLQDSITSNTKLFLLCSPHNPVGRVWQSEELNKIAQICYDHNIVVFADEIHCDLVYPPNKHTPFASLSDNARNISLSAIGPAKSFNMAGFAISSVVVTNSLLRKEYESVYERVHFGNGATLSYSAFEAAYKEGEEWLRELKKHLYSNYLALKSMLEPYEKLIRLTPIEGSYLAWLDCRGMGLSERKLREWFVKEAKLGLSSGVAFGREAKGFMRLNFAVPSDTMQKILQQLETALRRRVDAKD